MWLDDALLRSLGFQKWKMSGEASQGVRPYLDPRLLLHIAFVGFARITFAPVLLLFTYAFHMVFIVGTPVK